MDSLSKKWKRKQKEYRNGPDWTEVVNLKIKFDLSGGWNKKKIKANEKEFIELPTQSLLHRPRFCLESKRENLLNLKVGSKIKYINCSYPASLTLMSVCAHFGFHVTFHDNNSNIKKEGITFKKQIKKEGRY